ncbi:MAG: haloacid dehalogenase [Bacteroidota bacterium]
MFESYIIHKKAFIFELDNVLYPQKDYLLQVYYLFSEFMAYSEQTDAAAILSFMQAEFAIAGETQLFEKTAIKFNIPSKYQQNFELLHQNARLPLKLLLYKQMLSFLQEIVLERKEICLLIVGDPLQQINKIKQMEWHGLEKYLKTYFTAEFEPDSLPKTIDFILTKRQLQKEEILLISSSEEMEIFSTKSGISYLDMYKII